MQSNWTKTVEWGIAGAVVLALLNACGGAQVKDEQAVATKAKAAEQRSPIRFTGASEGLPMEGKWKISPRFFDVNQDGHLDLVAHPRLEDSPRVWFGNGQGEWTDASEGLKFSHPPTCGGQVDLGDINLDGHIDIAIGDHCSGLYVFLGDGQGRWEAVTERMNSAKTNETVDEYQGRWNPYAGFEALALGDINEDGFLDIVAGAKDMGGFSVFLGDGTGKNWRENTDPDGLPSAQDPESVEGRRGGLIIETKLWDMNKDGHLDVVATYYTGPKVWHGDGKGNWTEASEGLVKTGFGGIYRRLVLNDVDGDGLMDIGVSNMVNGAEVFLQNKNGTWQPLPDVMPEMLGGAHSLALGDLNGDGHSDIVIGGRLAREDYHYQLYVLLGDGRGNWKRIANTGLIDSKLPITWGLDMGDVNGDGRLDLAVTTDIARGPVQGNDFHKVQVWINESNE